MRGRFHAPLAPMLAVSICCLALACSQSSDSRALVLLDVRVAENVKQPDAVRITTTEGSALVTTHEFPWAGTPMTTQPLGLFYSKPVPNGAVTLVAEAVSAGIPVARGERSGVTLKAGEATVAIELVLSAIVNTGMGGTGGTAMAGNSGGGVGGSTQMAGAGGAPVGGQGGMGGTDVNTGGMVPMAGAGGADMGGSGGMSFPTTPPTLAACVEVDHWGDCQIPNGTGDWPISGLAIAPDGMAVAVGGGDGLVKTYSLGGDGLQATGKQLQVARNPMLAYAPDGSKLAIGDDGGKLRIANLDLQAQPLDAFDGDGFEGLAFVPNSDFLVSMSWRGSLRVWSVSGSTVVREHPFGHNVVGFAMGPGDGVNAQWIATSESGSAKVKFINVLSPSNMAVQQELVVPGMGEVTALAWSNDGSRLAVGTSSLVDDNKGRVHLYDVTTLSAPAQLGPVIVGAIDSQDPGALAFHPGGDHLAVGWGGFGTGGSTLVYKVPENTTSSMSYVPSYIAYRMGFALGGGTLIFTELACKVAVCTDQP